MVFSFTEIAPASQDRSCRRDPLTSWTDQETSSVKLGYPPRPLTLVPELPVSSLNLKSGDQLTVIESKGSNATLGGNSGGGISHSSKPMNTSASSTTQRGPSNLVGAAPGANRKVPASAPPIRAPASVPTPKPSSSGGPEKVSIRIGTLVHRVCWSGSLGRKCLIAELHNELPFHRLRQMTTRAFSRLLALSLSKVFQLHLVYAKVFHTSCIFVISDRSTLMVSVALSVVAEAIKNDPFTWSDAFLGYFTSIFTFGRL